MPERRPKGAQRRQSCHRYAQRRHKDTPKKSQSNPSFRSDAQATSQVFIETHKDAPSDAQDTSKTP